MITSYKDLTIGKYQELRAIEATEPIDAQVEMISILADMDIDAILNLPLNEYSKMVSGLNFLTTQPVVSNKAPKNVKINGKEYEVLRKVEDMTAGQYIDYQNYLSHNDMEKWLPYILSCFIIPKGKKYNDGYDLTEVIDDITNHLPIEIALSVSAFFLHKWESLTNAMLTYLGWKMRRMARKEKDTEMKEMLMKVSKEMVMLRDSIKLGVGLHQ